MNMSMLCFAVKKWLEQASAVFLAGTLVFLFFQLVKSMSKIKTT